MIVFPNQDGDPSFVVGHEYRGLAVELPLLDNDAAPEE